MNYDLQQLNELLSNLELDIEKVTESEKDLRQFFNLKSSSVDYYVEHIDVLNSLLNCCFGDNDVDPENLDKIYDLLRNDLYKFKKEQIKIKNINFNKVDQLEFFNFLNKLYNDLDFIERNSNKKKELLVQVKEIHNKLEHILKYQIKEYFKDTEIDTKRIKDFKFQSKQELYDEAYKRLMQLDLSSCLKNIYCKDAIFTTQDDVKLLFLIVNTEFCQKQTSEFKEFFKFNIDIQKDKAFLWKLGAIFAGAGTLSIASLPMLSSQALTLFGSLLAQNVGLTAFSDSVNRHTQKKTEKENDALNKDEIVEQKYKQLEDDAFYEASIVIRYDNEAFEELKKFDRLLKDFESKETAIKTLYNDCNSIQRAFEQLEKQLNQLQKQKQSEIEYNELVKTPYPTTEQTKKTFDELKEHFKSFSREDNRKLIRLIQTSPEKVEQIREFIKTAKLFNKDLSTIKTFEELMLKLREFSKPKQNATQEYLARMMDKAEKTIASQQPLPHSAISI